LGARERPRVRHRPRAEDREWRADFCRAVDRALLRRKEVAVEGPLRRITVEGFFSLKAMRAWVEEVGRVGWAVLMVWDLVDLPGSFVGAKAGLQGVGGGCETVLYGADLPQACRFQTVNFVSDE
jgi:hypothetical protein